MFRKSKEKAEERTTIQSLDDVNAVLGELHTLCLNETLIKAKLEKELSGVRAKHQESLSGMERRQDALRDQLETAIRKNEAWLNGRSSVKLANGTCGLRKKPPSLHLPEDVVSRLDQLGTDEALAAIRVVKSPNKTLLKQWPAEDLTGIGGKLVTETAFFVKMAG